MNEHRIAALDKDLVLVARSVRVLSSLAWSADSAGRFLKDWRRGKPLSPKVNQERRDLSREIVRLEAIAAKCDIECPVEKFLSDTARSYAEAARMLGAIGTPEFTQHSTIIYGRPDHVYKLSGVTAVDAARFFLERTDELLGSQHIPETEFNISAESFSRWLQMEVDRFFGKDTVAVRQDPEISAKALAGASRIRVRSTAAFSALDRDQLLQHEAFVHTTTMQNGNRQPRLHSLALGAPRTTRTQEGIAVLSELITNAMDIERLRRVALRVIAVDNAMNGADFIDLFKFFLDAGQSEEESVISAQRIFRGGAVKGGIVFTKDAVYLSGLLEAHTFMRVAIRDNRPELIRNVFAGRLTIADAVRLAPLFESGWLKPPHYLPPWAADLRRLSAFMAYSAFVSNIQLEKITLNRILDLEAEVANPPS